MNFIFVLSGWEGSAADSRILRDVVTRPNGLRVPNGYYYLCDGGYTNCNSFFAPYRGNHQEYFNLKHVIKCSFGILKAMWGILRSNSTTR
ncbi:hypothetical protein ACS0TY_026330 [Phlomoides rotata]